MDGLSIGLQLVGRRLEEEKGHRVAQAIAALLGRLY